MQNFFVGAFLYNPKSKSVLLHRRDMNTSVNPGRWAYFGGMSEGEESRQDAIVRELREELDIEVRPSELKDLSTFYHESKVQGYVFVLESELKKSDMTLKEGAGFDWVPLADVFDYDLTEYTAKVLRILDDSVLE